LMYRGERKLSKNRVPFQGIYVDYDSTTPYPLQLGGESWGGDIMLRPSI